MPNSPFYFSRKVDLFIISSELNYLDLFLNDHQAIISPSSFSRVDYVMELIFLGTSAGVPTRTRNVTAILLDLQHPTHGGLWLFDCGEGTQHQLLRTTYHPGKLDKIFITHLHGDHLFGLLGLLCSRSMVGIAHPLTVFGPKGIAKFIEISLRLSDSRTNYPLKIVEIVEGIIFDDGNHKVTARLLNHPVECYGYRIEEHDKPGTLNAAALMADGVKPGPLFHLLKQGKIVILENGRVVNGQRYLSAPVPGKKLAIFGDTAPCSAALALAKGVDVMVHEATLEAGMEEKANGRGHSSTHQAAKLACDADVGKLIVTHISSRYNARADERLVAECRGKFPESELAKDFTRISI